MHQNRQNRCHYPKETMIDFISDNLKSDDGSLGSEEADELKRCSFMLQDSTEAKFYTDPVSLSGVVVPAATLKNPYPGLETILSIVAPDPIKKSEVFCPHALERLRPDEQHVSIIRRSTQTVLQDLCAGLWTMINQDWSRGVLIMPSEYETAVPQRIHCSEQPRKGLALDLEKLFEDSQFQNLSQDGKCAVLTSLQKLSVIYSSELFFIRIGSQPELHTSNLLLRAGGKSLGIVLPGGMSTGLKQSIWTSRILEEKMVLAGKASEFQSALKRHYDFLMKETTMSMASFVPIVETVLLEGEFQSLLNEFASYMVSGDGNRFAEDLVAGATREMMKDSSFSKPDPKYYKLNTIETDAADVNVLDFDLHAFSEAELTKIKNRMLALACPANAYVNKHFIPFELKLYGENIASVACA